MFPPRSLPKKIVDLHNICRWRQEDVLPPRGGGERPRRSEVGVVLCVLCWMSCLRRECVQRDAWRAVCGVCLGVMLMRGDEGVRKKRGGGATGLFC